MTAEMIREQELDEELADVLIAISVISKRLARKIAARNRSDDVPTESGGEDDG
ncbi:MAG: hypothetical protein LUI12_05245 [Clostridiales bacterium]|nr:hypothetical protein [Clostridiales bacterium]